MSVSDGAGTPGSYSLDYVINEIEKVESGMLQVTAPGIGVLAKIPFTPSAEGYVTFDVDPSRMDFGPTVAFRARCPEGETEWFTLGTRFRTSSDRCRDRASLTSHRIASRCHGH